jgi:hypothetical protein
MLAVEVDEGQHKAKSYHEDVDARYNDLAMVFGGKWVFIRFNPDSHADADGKVPWDSLRTGTPTSRGEFQAATVLRSTAGPRALVW